MLLTSLAGISGVFNLHSTHHEVRTHLPCLYKDDSHISKLTLLIIPTDPVALTLVLKK